MPDYANYPSETAKYRSLTRPYCYLADGTPACVLDVASQGDPVVPWAFQLDLPEGAFAVYNSNHPLRAPVQIRSRAESLFIDTASLDVLYSSHLLEDFADWEPVLKEWVRVLKPGGKLIVIIPDRTLWLEALAKGQTPNDAHRHEGHAGELSTYAERLGLAVIEDRLTALFPGDYSILFVAVKK